MTWRAVFLGLLGAIFLCGISYFNDHIMRQTYLVGNNLPLSVYGGLVLFVLLLNPLLYRWKQRWALTGRELAVVLGLTLAACCIPGSGLMRTFTCSLMMPHQFGKTEPGWQEQGVLDQIPPRLLADPSRNENDALGGFLQGLSVGGESIAPGQVPWYAWTRTLAYWLPLVLLLWFGLIALAVVVHRQWADHEQLPYPIARFADALLPAPGTARGGVFSDRLFWLGLGVVLAIHLNNYGCQWFPRVMIRIPTEFNFAPLRKLFPVYANVPGAWKLFVPMFYFSVIGFAYFLATDVSFSLGIASWLYLAVVGVLAGYGVAIDGGGLFAPNPKTFLVFGAYLGMLLVLLYTGRHYYGTLARQALFLPVPERLGGPAVWAVRLCALCLAGFVLGLVSVGLDWQLAVLYTGGVVLVFLVMSRVVAETGLFFIQANYFPSAVVLGLFGGQALGPQALLLMFFFGSVFLIDPREALLPFMVNSLKLADLRQIKLGRLATVCGITLVVGLAVAVPVTLYFQYDRGVDLADGWATSVVPKAPFEETVRVQQRLVAQERLETARAVHGWQRFTELSPSRAGLVALALGLMVVLGLTACRLRFTRWPIHPVLFLVWHTYPIAWFGHSFLLGWLIKVLMTKYGGAPSYQRLKPLMFGLIAGDMLGGVIPSLLGFIYYLVTGEVPKSWHVLPG